MQLSISKIADQLLNKDPQGYRDLFLQSLTTFGVDNTVTVDGEKYSYEESLEWIIQAMLFNEHEVDFDEVKRG